MGVRKTAAQQARMDAQEEQERYGLFTSWEEELLERDAALERFWERADARTFEMWG